MALKISMSLEDEAKQLVREATSVCYFFPNSSL